MEYFSQNFALNCTLFTVLSGKEKKEGNIQAIKVSGFTLLLN